MDDAELLRSYVTSRSEAAFAQLVQSHAGLVYSTALRVTGDGQLARDVAQEVFIKLAREAGALRHGKALAAWLYRVAHARAVNALRTEARRRHRELEAMKNLEIENVPDTESAWTALKPSLDQAMADLNKTDQAALVLRFFSNKSLLEVGQALGLSEEAARKRVGRAVEKLRTLFARRGVQVSSAALVSVLTANVVQSAPAGLAASLSSSAVTAASTGGSASLLTTALQAILMTKTTAIIVAAVAVGAVVTPLLLRKGQSATPAPIVPAANLTQTPAAAPTAPAQASARQGAAATAVSLLARVADLPQLTPQQIDSYVTQNKRNAESLLAAFRASKDKTWLIEAATRFPENPNVQYEIIASGAAPDSQRQWIDAYKASSADNALAWYFSALDYFKTGDKERTIQELAEATRKPTFRAELAPTLQALEELNLSAGRAADEARVAAFQTCAQFPHLPQMRDLAKTMKEMAQEYRSSGNTASADSLAAMGLVLGGHLSAGSGSQTLINQLVGISIEKAFLQQLGPGVTHDPFGRPISELSAQIERHQQTLKQFGPLMQSLMTRLDDTEWAVYLERVKLYGEESALAWLQEKHGGQ